MSESDETHARYPEGLEQESSVEHGPGSDPDGAPTDADPGGSFLTGVVPPVEAPVDAETETHTDEVATADAQRSARYWGPYRRLTFYRSVRRDREILWPDRDQRENESSKLPASESVQIAAIWVIELYTPSTISGLLDGIASLDWEYGRSRDESLSKWMNDVRHGRSAGWTSLGLVSPVGDPHLMRERTARLPRGVKAALPTLMSVTSSVSALATCFILDDDAATVLHEPMTADYATYAEPDPLFRRRHAIPFVLWDRPIRLGTRYQTPALQRRAAVQRGLDDTERQCTAWVRDNLPGAFSAGIRNGLLPTAMLLVSDETRLLTEDARKIRALEGTAMDRDYDHWTSDEWSECRMALPHAWRKEELRLRFGCRRRDAFPKKDGYADPESNWTISQRADELVRGLTTRWALSCLLDGYHQRLASYRDQSASSARYRPVRDLRHVRRLARTEMYDMLAATSEISSFASDRRSYAYDVIEMKHVGFRGSDDVDLLDELRRAQTTRGEHVDDEARLLLSTLSTSAEVTQTISNIRIQRFVTLLTVVSIVIAVLAVVIAAG